MGHKGRRRQGQARKAHSEHPRDAREAGQVVGGTDLELVLKSDTVGTLDAAKTAVAGIHVAGVKLAVIEAGVGDVSKSDLLMALTGSRLVVGFSVGVVAMAPEFARQEGIEVRLYDVIDHLAEDVEQIARTLAPREPGEVRLGQARVVALFKGSRKGIILGCEVVKGKLAVGQRFRVISAMGPVHEGRIESLHIEADAVREAHVGQQVGLKIQGWKAAHLGDLVESFEPAPRDSREAWTPHGGVVRGGRD